VLSLREAWMGGWTRNLTHLDGHVVRLSKARGEVVQPGQVDTIQGEGMPIYHEGHLHEHHDGDEFGKLYVEYVVVLPDQMEKPMEKEFWALWEKWRARKGVDLAKDSGRPSPAPHNEL
jgi:DnaJ-related protein SCJ1